MDILTKIKKAKLIGRGGGSFPTALKWELVKKASGEKKYLVCNAAEGEPGVKKDGFILEHYPERVIDGIELALDFLDAEQAVIYINFQYYKKYYKNLKKIIADAPIIFFIKPADAGYIGGEESAILNAIENKRIEPRLRPPFPTTKGLFNSPTLINNVETLYNVSLVNSGDYKNIRFYTVSGDCLWEGVYELPEEYTIEKILKETKNYPFSRSESVFKFPFFVQVGGDASGEALSSWQLKRPVSGAGSITVYSLTKHKPKNLIRNWMRFFQHESCGQCTPCREGTYRIMEMINSSNPDWDLIGELLDNLEESSFCGLGKAVSVPIKSFIKNVLNHKHYNFKTRNHLIGN